MGDASDNVLLLMLAHSIPFTTAGSRQATKLVPFQIAKDLGKEEHRQRTRQQDTWALCRPAQLRRSHQLACVMPLPRRS